MSPIVLCCFLVFVVKRIEETVACLGGLLEVRVSSSLRDPGVFLNCLASCATDFTYHAMAVDEFEVVVELKVCLECSMLSICSAREANVLSIVFVDEINGLSYDIFLVGWSSYFCMVLLLCVLLIVSFLSEVDHWDVLVVALLCHDRSVGIVHHQWSLKSFAVAVTKDGEIVCTGLEIRDLLISQDRNVVDVVLGQEWIVFETLHLEDCS